MNPVGQSYRLRSGEERREREGNTGKKEGKGKMEREGKERRKHRKVIHGRGLDFPRLFCPGNDNVL